MDKWLEMIEKEYKARGLNKKRLAELSGLSQATISYWFKGKRNPSQLLKRLVEEALGLRHKHDIDPDIVLSNALCSHPRLSTSDVDDIMALINAKLSRGGSDEMQSV